jgi:hypothetical protein
MVESARDGTQKIKFGALYEDKPAVVAFLRRLGCQICRVREGGSASRERTGVVAARVCAPPWLPSYLRARPPLYAHSPLSMQVQCQDLESIRPQVEAMGARMVSAQPGAATARGGDRAPACRWLLRRTRPRPPAALCAQLHRASLDAHAPPPSRHRPSPMASRCA